MCAANNERQRRPEPGPSYRVESPQTGHNLGPHSRVPLGVLATMRIPDFRDPGALENEKSRDTDRNDVSRLHIVPEGGLEPPRPLIGH